MIAIQALTSLNLTDLSGLMTGYTSTYQYRVAKTESDLDCAITLHLVALPQPYIKRYPAPDAETLRHYATLPQVGLSFAAYDGAVCVGMALAEPQRWNRSLWVREFHVAEPYRGQGIGRHLMAELVRQGRAADFRVLVCETQNTNVPAICFYRKLGFGVEGIDISYYSNRDYPDGEVAVFMKKRLP